MASASGNIKILETSINVITEYESQSDFAPTIYSQYNRGEFIQVFNGTWFMTDLSKTPVILPKPLPLFSGLRIFDTIKDEPVITYVMTGNTGSVLSGYTVDANHTLRYIDGGDDYYQTGVRNESNNFGWLPRSNTELFTTITRSDIDGFDYPEFSVRGTRKIPLTGETICGPESESSNRSNYNWFFGINAGINFNPIESGATPTSISGSVVSTEGSSVISNTEGDLLFYTDGETIYTSANTIMTNGTGLNGNTGSTQSSLIVPRPTTNQYYVFTTNYDGANNGFSYSVVDMSLQGGKGQVQEKNIDLLSNGLTEKVAGAKHSNGIDYWAITHKTGDSIFYSYKITSGGTSTPVLTNIGSVNNTPRGYLKVSHDASKIVNAIYDEDIIDIMDFTSSAGTLSNLITITGFTFDNGPYGVEFSSDSSKLYISDGAQGKIYQFDLSYSSSTDMVDYSIIVADITGNTNGSLQMGPDEKIYVSNFDNDTLHVIHYPNGLGVNCNFDEDSVKLLSGTTSQWGLPNQINNTILSCDRYAYIRETGSDNFNFEYTINDVTEVIGDKELNFYSEIYKYNNTNGVFNSNAVYSSQTIPYTAFTTANTTTINVNGIGEGEFIIKGFYEYPINTFVGKQLGYRYNTIDTRKKGDLYGLYNPITDWYFLNMYRADIPILSIGNSNESLILGGFSVNSFYTTSGLTGYTLSVSNGDQIISYNGSVLSKDIDYSVTLNQLAFNFEVLDNQLVTIAYVEGGTSNAYVDTSVVTTINSGTTNSEKPNDKIYYNIDFNKYEFYSDTPTNGDIVLTVNGSTLINGVEYYKSITNNKRTILEIIINSGDIVQAFYVPQAGVIGSIKSISPIINWSISNAPVSGQTGTFTVEFVDDDDTSFNNILYSNSTEYVIGQRSYNAGVLLSGGSFGNEFLYRVKNEKRYTTINGDIIKSERISGAIPIEITTNALNSY